MAQQGFYTDPPSRRMGYDADGTIVLYVSENLASIVEVNTGVKQNMNDESDSSYTTPHVHQYITFIFPELRSITHYYAVVSKSNYLYHNVNAGEVQVSTDTTNGVDGSWTTVAASWQTNATPGSVEGTPTLTTPGFPDMREEIESLPVDGIKAIRFHLRGAGLGSLIGETPLVKSFQLYGHKFSGETPHRIDFCYSDGSELTQDFDYGDQPRGTDRTWAPGFGYNVGSGLYLRNRSPDKVATDVALTMQNLTSDMITRLTLSKDDTSYGTLLQWTEIQPLQVVGPVYVKHDVPSDTPMGLYTARLVVNVGSWV